ncbi:MAG: hypothetical protein HC836_39645 [Richelia sp. RM2_1_2]|nr:hypothetical protein [Richelia sp. RM1_1_1]NJO64080.1 hypothetical protein [Richelia sp. RM2_1_2]
MADSKLPEQRDIKTENGNYSEHIGKNYIQAETVHIYEKDGCSATNTITQKVTGEKQLTFVLTGTIGDVNKAKLRAIQAHLRKISGDAELTIIDVEEGSIKLKLEGSPESLKKLKELFESGELIDVLDIPVEDVYFASAETEDFEENTEDNDKSSLVGQLPGEDISESVSNVASPLEGFSVSGALIGIPIYGTVANNVPSKTDIHTQKSQQNLAESATKIQQLLEQLEKSYPAETIAGKMLLAKETIKYIENNPTLRKQLLSVLKTVGVRAFKQFLNHPAANFVMASLEDWQKTKRS